MLDIACGSKNHAAQYLSINLDQFSEFTQFFHHWIQQ